VTKNVNTFPPRVVLWSYLVLNVVGGTVAGALQLAVPLFALKLAATTAQIGLIRGIGGVGMLLLVVPAGFLVDHFGARRLFLLGSLFTTALTFSIPFASIPFHLVLLQGVAGLFGSVKGTSLNSSFFERIKDIGLDKVGWFKGSMSIGMTFVGPLLAGWAVAVLDLPVVFRILSALTLVPTALVFVFHRDVPRASDQGLLQGIAGQWRDFREVWRENPLGLPLATEALATGCFSCFAAFVVPIVVVGMHRPPSHASFLVSLEGGVFIATVFLAGKLVPKVAPSRLYLLAATATSLSLVGVGLSHSFASLATFAASLGVGLGLFNLVTATRQGLVRGSRGKTVSLFSAAIGAGASLGPMVGGQLSVHVGTSNVFLLFVPAFLGLSLLASTPERRRETSFLQTVSETA
jgi:MFS family permease